MSTTITSQSEIPSAPFYVTATDSFMSGWGPAAGKTNRVILPCESLAEAEVVEANARQRSDMKSVHICAAKPKLNRWTLYSLMDREAASRWYEPRSWP